MIFVVYNFLILKRQILRRTHVKYEQEPTQGTRHPNPWPGGEKRERKEAGAE